MSSEMITTETVQDVTDELQLVAETPQQMAVAQASLGAWCDAKIEILTKDADELAENVNIAETNGWKLTALKKQHTLSLKRIEFYRKVKVAVDNGFCVIPNFPVQTFAIRTRKRVPDAKASRWNNSKDQSSEGPPHEEGRYVDSVPFQDHRQNYKGKDKDGKDEFTTEWFASSFDDEIEFPISVAKPIIMTATTNAMALKCFDEIGVLPERHKRKQDPLVVGRIKDPRSTTNRPRWLSFLIAWYVDTKDL